MPCITFVFVLPLGFLSPNRNKVYNEYLIMLINKKGADLHFGAVYVSCICSFKKYYVK